MDVNELYDSVRRGIDLQMKPMFTLVDMSALKPAKPTLRTRFMHFRWWLRGKWNDLGRRLFPDIVNDDL